MFQIRRIFDDILPRNRAALAEVRQVWSEQFSADDFKQNARMLREMRLPTLVIQEGGCRTRTVGANARNFFQGLVDGAYRI